MKLFFEIEKNLFAHHLKIYLIHCASAYYFQSIVVPIHSQPNQQMFLVKPIFPKPLYSKSGNFDE